ncbi:hypothetical protein [uncultured Massilia sp.]|uniref:hypothetical protein n=1 Tax=uncultured Massilia sp. TaxID=169973 RepID=UPI0025CE1EC3|nr:hypothetical protein [uncultured Massilia sp.]
MRFPIAILLLCGALDAAAQPLPAAPAPHPRHPVLATPTDLRAALQAADATPGGGALAAFTPYGRRRFARSIRWGSAGVGGFGTAAPLRELDAGQLAAVLDLLDAGAYLPRLRAQLAGAPLRLPAPAIDVERALDSLEDVAVAAGTATSITTTGAPTLLRAYDSLFGARMDAAALRRAGDGDLPPLFDAAALASMGNPNARAVDDLLRVHDELGRRGIATGRTFDATALQALVAARRFDAARAFRAAHPALAHVRVPRVRDDLGPDFRGRSVLRPDAGAGTLVRAPAPAPAGTQLLVMVGAGCHFSRNALAAIGADPALQARLRAANAMLVVTPDDPVPLDLLAEWNAAHPALPLAVPYDDRGWPRLHMASVPHFYLLRDGKIADEDSGWPEGGRGDALLRLLDASVR